MIKYVGIKVFVKDEQSFDDIEMVFNSLDVYHANDIYEDVYVFTYRVKNNNIFYTYSNSDKSYLTVDDLKEVNIGDIHRYIRK